MSSPGIAQSACLARLHVAKVSPRRGAGKPSRDPCSGCRRTTWICTTCTGRIRRSPSRSLSRPWRCAGPWSLFVCSVCKPSSMTSRPPVATGVSVRACSPSTASGRDMVSRFAKVGYPNPSTNPHTACTLSGSGARQGGQGQIPGRQRGQRLGPEEGARRAPHHGLSAGVVPVVSGRRGAEGEAHKMLAPSCVVQKCFMCRPNAFWLLVGRSSASANGF